MVWRRFVRISKRHPRTVCLVTYLLLGFPLPIAQTWNSDPIPTFITDHPEISFAPVSGWYGPGTWLALVLSIISGTVTLLYAAYCRSPPQKWSPDIIAVVVYCLASCWNLKKLRRTIQGAEGDLTTSMLPAVIAADRAVIFSGGVLVVYAILLMPHLHPFATNSPPRRITIAQFVLVWTASFIPMFVIPPEMDSDTSSLPKYFPCLETDSACHSGRRLVQTYVFLSQTFPAMAITMFTQYWRFYSEFNPRTFFLLFGIFGLAMSALVILFNTPNWHRGVAWGLPIGIITTFLIPAVLGILTILSFFLVMYPMVCAFEFGTILVLAAIPRSGVFPHSGISMGEVDQIGSLLIVVVYHSIHGMSNGVTKIWKRLRQREPRQEEELPLSGA